MTIKRKFYPNGKKKKEVIPMKKNELPFKLIVGYTPDEDVCSVMEKPNLKEIEPSLLVSGAHVFKDPKNNHVDFFLSGSLVSKEYPASGSICYYGYELSGSNVVMPK